MSIAPFIFIVPECYCEYALLAHERVHFDEQIRVLTIPWWVCYLLSADFRFKAELRAYSKQIELGGVSIDKAAELIATKYRLNVTALEAAEALSTLKTLKQNIQP